MSIFDGCKLIYYAVQNEMSYSFFSIDNIERSANLSSTIVVLRRVLILFKLEKDLSHSALVIAIVSDLCEFEDGLVGWLGRI